MDDMYQYAASAARENEQRSNASQGEEDDVILQAFKSFDFRSRWTSLVDTVKKQVRHLFCKVTYPCLVTKFCTERRSSQRYSQGLARVCTGTAFRYHVAERTRRR